MRYRISFGWWNNWVWYYGFRFRSYWLRAHRIYRNNGIDGIDGIDGIYWLYWSRFWIWPDRPNRSVRRYDWGVAAEMGIANLRVLLPISTATRNSWKACKTAL